MYIFIGGSIKMEIIRQMLISAETQVILNLGTIIAVTIGLIKILSVWKDIENKIKLHDDRINDNSEKIDSLDSENNLIKTTQAVLDTKLENIEAGVIEIKAMLSRHIEK